jgi:hypothetical protein
MLRFLECGERSLNNLGPCGNHELRQTIDRKEKRHGLTGAKLNLLAHLGLESSKRVERSDTRHVSNARLLSDGGEESGLLTRIKTLSIAALDSLEQGVDIQLTNSRGEACIGAGAGKGGGDSLALVFGGKTLCGANLANESLGGAGSGANLVDGRVRIILHELPGERGLKAGGSRALVSRGRVGIAHSIRNRGRGRNFRLVCHWLSPL